MPEPPFAVTVTVTTPLMVDPAVGEVIVATSGGYTIKDTAEVEVFPSAPVAVIKME